MLNANGKPVPFGAIAAIQDASLADSGIVGDRGELYLSGLPEKDRLRYHGEKTPQQNASSIIHFRHQKVRAD